jgi:hypothetical protein
MQTPFWCIDLALHPDAQALYPELLGWAEQRAAMLLSRSMNRSAFE